MSYITIAVAVIGAGVSFAGAQKAADAAEEAGKAQRDAAAAAARNEELQTAENVQRERINKNRRLARLRAQMGASGLTMEGTMADAFTETAGRLEVGIQDQARAGALQASNLYSQGDMALWEARTQASAARLSSYGTLLTDLSGIASTYKTPKTAPATNATTASG